VVAGIIVLPRVFGGSGEPKETLLGGQTSRGADIVLTVVDGKLAGVQTSAAAWCPQQRTWIDWPWVALDRQQRVEFEHDGSRFVLDEREAVDALPFSTYHVVMRGELDDDGTSARGSIHARAIGDRTSCEGTTRFSARRTS
jgi:hypothetical protein